MVVLSSSNTFERISWQETQNVSVLVSSSPVLNAPQKITPATKPASTRNPRLNMELGRINTPQISRANESTRLQKDGLGTSVVVIAVSSARLPSAPCRCRRNHCRPEFSRCVARSEELTSELQS